MVLGDYMETIKISPRGYCHGVVNAINTITNLKNLSTNKNITILGMVIHNKQIVSFFENRGIKTLDSTGKTRLELLEEIDDGIVVFTAHGVSPEVYKRAEEKGLEVIDTSCTDVIKSQNIVQELLDDNYEVINIGKHTHPESEAVNGFSERVHVVETVDEVKALKLKNDKIALTNQTTMSLYDIFNLSEEIRVLYPNLHFVDEVCNATRIRQEAIKNQDQSIEHCFIVGDRLSNNSRKLAEVSIKEANIPSTLIESLDQIDVQFLKTLNKVSVSSGASTPTQVTNEIISFLERFDKTDPSTWKNVSQITIKNVISMR